MLGRYIFVGYIRFSFVSSGYLLVFSFAWLLTILKVHRFF